MLLHVTAEMLYTQPKTTSSLHPPALRTRRKHSPPPDRSTHLCLPAVALLAGLNDTVAADSRTVGRLMQSMPDERAVPVLLQEGFKVPNAAAAKGFCPADMSKIKQLSILVCVNTSTAIHSLKISVQFQDLLTYWNKAQRSPGCLSVTCQTSFYNTLLTQAEKHSEIPCFWKQKVSFLNLSTQSLI